MKILFVLSLLLSVSLAFNDFTVTTTANNTQCPSTQYDTGSCTIAHTYVDSTKNLAVAFTCSGLKGNITALHLHDVGSSDLVYNTGTVIYTVTLPTDGSLTFTTTWTLDDATIQAICHGTTYWNFHTDFDGSCEVRSNLATITPLCFVSGGVPIGGNAVTVGEAPTSAGTYPYATFCGGWSLDVIVTGGASEVDAGGYFFVCYDSSTSYVYISGNIYGLDAANNEVHGIYVTFPGETYDFVSSYYTYNWNSGAPFSFTRSLSSVWEIAQLVSSNLNFTVETSAFSGGQFTQTVSNSAFPTAATTTTNPCHPLANYKLPAAALTCYSGYQTNDGSENLSSLKEVTCADDTYLCSIYRSGTYDYYQCIQPSYYSQAWTCSCPFDSTSFGSNYWVCNTDRCNVFSLAFSVCFVPDASSSSTLVSGVSLSLLLAFIMKWFN